MKRAAQKIGMILLLLFITNSAHSAEISGGVVDTGRGEIGIIHKINEKMNALLSIQPHRIIEKKEGSLFIVNSWGYAKEAYKGFTDKSGITISVPKDSADKVVFLNRYGEMIGGAGLSEKEAEALMKVKSKLFTPLMESYKVIKLGIPIKDKMAAIKEAVKVFDTKYSEKEQIQLFIATVKMLTGSEFAGLTQEIILNADYLEEATEIGRSLTELDPLAKGIYHVNYGDNGGIDTDNPISYGDNGGIDTDDPVSYGDNGGIDINAIVQGWAIDPELPPMPAKDLNLGGVTIMLVH